MIQVITYKEYKNKTVYKRFRQFYCTIDAFEFAILKLKKGFRVFIDNKELL